MHPALEADVAPGEVALLFWGSAVGCTYTGEREGSLTTRPRPLLPSSLRPAHLGREGAFQIPEPVGA